MEELHDRGAIEPRSRRNRAAIEEFTWWNRRQSSGRRSTNDQDHDRGPIAARSWHDHGPIAARSWSDRGAIVAQLRLDRGPIAAKMHDIRRQN